MIDVHCHLLPEIDDGPKNMEAAFQLAQQAYDNGVRKAVVTPHIHRGRWENSIGAINDRAAEFRLALKAESIDLKIGVAGEVRICGDIIAMVAAKEIPFLGEWKGHRVVLLEMPHSHILPGTDKIIGWLLKQNILPMIAHPERNKDVMRRLDKLDPFIEMGCLFQVTAGSVIGQFGDAARTVATELLERGLVTVLASDAHHIKRRPCNLAEGYDGAVSIVGIDEARDMVFDTPMAMTSSLFDTGVV